MITFYKSFGILIRLIEFLIIVRIILSMIGAGFNNQIGRIVYEMTEPILSVGRDLIYKLGIDTGIIDFSPWVSILVLRGIYYLIGKVIF